MYVLVAVMWGDGDQDIAGKRVWFHEFRTRTAAEACMVWLKEDRMFQNVNIFDDFIED